ncbi:MAG: DUF2330 domain-containing protein [Myxococcales bacterium]|nr:DUF2330 domain-containing protein [Myxococcales bacterium]
MSKRVSVRRRRVACASWGIALAIGVSAGLESPAAACGGTFCDNPGPTQPAMPVDQTGENVVFVMRDGQVEAHIQIQYSGDPERFAWLVPVPVTPELEVGSQQLFVNLLNATVPSFSLTTRVDGCGGGGFSSSSSSGCGMSAASDDSGSAAGGTQDGFEDTDSDAEVVARREKVGVFDVSILEGASPDDVATWLSDNGYLGDDQAPPILQDYAERNYVFVAVKLRSGAGVSEIHPLVIRYPGTEPCVPLKLTAIAASEDMDVRAFFLGDRRVVPTNFKHVELNQLQLDWLSFGSNYRTVVSRAVDSPVANGRAFITEYAGPASVVDKRGIVDSRWNSQAFEDLSPTQAMLELAAQGLFSCSGGECASLHPLVEPILAHFLPVPPGITRNEYYGCVGCYPDSFDAWDAPAFAADLDERVMAPAEHAMSVLVDSTFLTRLYTRISPAEMTEDPTFAARDGYEGVSNALMASTRTLCSGATALYTPGGHEVYLGTSLQTPSFPGMPYASRVVEYADDGSMTVLVDNGASISHQLEEHNDRYAFDPADQPAFGSSRNETGEGCACRVQPARTQQGGALALALGALLLRRRQRRRCPRPRLRPASRFGPPAR